jgi:hypoxanthine-DNA glycosylase
MVAEKFVSEKTSDQFSAHLQGLAPLVCQGTRVLILGSFPGAASLAAQQYYAHPRNQFWPILQAIFEDFSASKAFKYCSSSYQIRSEWLLSKGLGLWDVYARCDRAGSLDANIRNAKANDLAALQQQLPNLSAFAHNGGESFLHAQLGVRLGLAVHKLPSSSPANAAWSFERKLAAWREVLALHGLVTA